MRRILLLASSIRLTGFERARGNTPRRELICKTSEARRPRARQRAPGRPPEGPATAAPTCGRRAPAGPALPIINSITSGLMHIQARGGGAQTKASVFTP